MTKQIVPTSQAEQQAEQKVTIIPSWKAPDIKICILGATGPAKKELAEKLAEVTSEGAAPSESKPSDYYSIYQKKFVDGKEIIIEYWYGYNTSDFHHLDGNNGFASKADAIIMAYDITNKSSFDEIIESLKSYPRVTGQLIYFVGDNVDSGNTGEVSSLDVDLLSDFETLKAEVSTKTGKYIDELSETLIKACIAKKNHEKAARIEIKAVNKITFLQTLKSKLKETTFTRDDILDLFLEIKKRDGLYQYIHKQNHSYWDRFRLFFKSNVNPTNEESNFWHTDTYQKAVELLEKAYRARKVDQSARKRQNEADALIDYVRGNAVTHYKETATRTTYKAP